MEFIAAICPQCGGSLQFDHGDRERKETFCKYCGSKVMVKEAIELKELSVRGINTVDDHVKNGETCLNLKEWARAEHSFLKAIDANPGDYRGWWGLVQVESRNFTKYGSQYSISKYLENSFSLATGEDLIKIKSVYDDYLASDPYKQTKEYKEQKAKIKRKVDAEVAKIQRDIQRAKERGMTLEEANKRHNTIVVWVMLGVVILYALLYALLQ